MQSFGYRGALYGIDCFVDRGRFGDATEKEYLVQPNCQCLMDKGVEFAYRLPAESADEEVEVLPLSQNTIDEIHGQTTVNGFEAVASAEILEEYGKGDRVRPELIQNLYGEQS
jgi:hypothetical protein